MGKKKERFRSSKVITNVVPIIIVIHMPVPPPRQYHIPAFLNLNVENPRENPRKVDYMESSSRIDFSAPCRIDSSQPCDAMK